LGINNGFCSSMRKKCLVYTYWSFDVYSINGLMA
jgi:hypothetical protein